MKKDEIVTINVFGIKTDVPKWQDCKRCGAKLACKFYGFTHLQPCDRCKVSKEYQDEENDKDKSLRNGGVSSAFENQRVAGVFEGKGTRFFTNSKGNIVKTEPLTSD